MMADSSDFASRSFWLGHKPYVPGEALDGSRSADIVVLERDVRCAEKIGVANFHDLNRAACREQVSSERIRCGHWDDHGLLVDPAALCRGLRQAALRRAVKLFEGTPVRSLERNGAGVVARTPFGDVTADRGLIATNAYACSIPTLKPFPLPPDPLRAAVLNFSQRALLRADDTGGKGDLASRPALRFLQ